MRHTKSRNARRRKPHILLLLLAVPTICRTPGDTCAKTRCSAHHPRNPTYSLHLFIPYAHNKVHIYIYVYIYKTRARRAHTAQTYTHTHTQALTHTQAHTHTSTHTSTHTHTHPHKHTHTHTSTHPHNTNNIIYTYT